jgi:hypothetical protein
MKRLTAIAVMLALVGWTTPARALINTIDPVPAATLLLPYFEVDLDNPQGVQTLFSINNASATAVLAHVVIWSDLSVPTLIFNVYLTGYDVATINLRDIFVAPGNLPRTASVGQDPGDQISNQGDFSQDINFASCNGFLPTPSLEVISQQQGVDYIAHLQAAHTGQPSPILLVGGAPGCAGQRLNDRIARGYITVDTVNACNLDLPFTPGYFINGGLGTATNQNVLWGDYFYVNSAENFAQGETLVHIEAAPGVGVNAGQGSYAINPETGTPGEYTFYGRYVAWSAADNREALATNFAARFLNGGTFDGGTSLAVWRDSKVNQGAFTCPAVAGVRPAWYPLGQEALVVFDEQENPSVVVPSPVAPAPPSPNAIPFPAEANRALVGGPAFPVPFTFGWIYLNLNQTSVVAGPNPPEDPLAAQAWVTAIHDAQGRFSVGYNATMLDSAGNALHFTPGP